MHKSIYAGPEISFGNLFFMFVIMHLDFKVVTWKQLRNQSRASPEDGKQKQNSKLLKVKTQ